MERILELLNNYMNNAKIKLDELDKNIQYKEYVLEENERDSTFIDEYEFTGIIEEKEYTISVDKSTWDKYDVGDSIPAKINRLGIVSLVE